MRVTEQTKADIADAAWAIAQRMTAFGYGEIEAELKIGAKQAMRIVRGWDAAGLLSPVQSGPGLRKPCGRRQPRGGRRKTTFGPQCAG
jgi:hypothetical protein